MITLNARFCDADSELGVLGRCGETNARRVVFYCGEVLEEYPGAEILCYIKRPGEREAYPKTLEKDGTNRILVMGEDETALPGTMRIELRAVDMDAVRRSTVYAGGVLRSLTAPGEVPGSPAQLELEDWARRFETI